MFEKFLFTNVMTLRCRGGTNSKGHCKKKLNNIVESCVRDRDLRELIFHLISYTWMKFDEIVQHLRRAKNNRQTKRNIFKSIFSIQAY